MGERRGTHLIVSFSIPSSINISWILVRWSPWSWMTARLQKLLVSFLLAQERADNEAEDEPFPRSSSSMMAPLQANSSVATPTHQYALE